MWHLLSIELFLRTFCVFEKRYCCFWSLYFFCAFSNKSRLKRNWNKDFLAKCSKLCKPWYWSVYIIQGVKKIVDFFHLFRHFSLCVILSYMKKKWLSDRVPGICHKIYMPEKSCICLNLLIYKSRALNIVFWRHRLDLAYKAATRSSRTRC